MNATASKTCRWATCMVLGIPIAGYIMNKKGWLPNSVPLRVGLSGMTTQMVSDISFHFIDTVNVRLKGEQSLNRFTWIIRDIWKKAGYKGFFYGIRATIFGSTLGGLTYFTLYKYLKAKIGHDKHAGPIKAFVIDFFAAAVAEAIALLVFFPFEMVKTRMQMDNRLFPYRDVFEALHRVTHPAPGDMRLTRLYEGCAPYFAQFIVYTTAQFACYEAFMRVFRKTKRHTKDRYVPWKYVFVASTASGMLASLMTNWLEVITIRKQIDPTQHVKDILHQEGAHILIKGIGPRIIYNVSQSVMVFFILTEMCRIYKVKFEG